MKALLLAVGVAALLSGCNCGDRVVVIECGPANCTGCCSLDGVCVTGDADGACGADGLQCNVCGAQQLCQASRCALVPTPIPDASVPPPPPDAGPTCQSKAGNGDVCASTGWCWEEPWPMGLQVTAVSGTSSSDLWVGAEGGLLFHFDGARWSSLPTGVATSPVSGISFGAAHGVFTAEHSVYERRDGGFALAQWDPQSSFEQPQVLDDVLYTSAYHVLYERSRGSWTSLLMSGGSSACFYDRLCPDRLALRKGATGLEGFAVGTFGAIAQLKSGRFELISGNSGAADGGALADLRSIASLGDGGYLATGPFAARAYADGAWRDVAPPQDAGLGGAFAAGPHTFVAGPQGSLFEWSGRWTSQTVPSRRALTGGVGFGASDAVAFGDRSLLRYDGSDWSQLVELAAERVFPGAPSEHALYAVAAAQGAGFAVGQGGLVLQREGTRWKAVNIGTSAQLYAVWADGCDRAWVAGEKGTLLQYDGAGWRPGSSGTTDALFGLWGPGGGAPELFAVGENGAVLAFDGTRWIRQSTPTRRTLAAVWGSDARHVWAAGQDGTLIFFDGATWSTVQNLPVASTFSAVTGRSATEVYVGSVDGQVLVFNGTLWSLLPSPTLSVQGLYAPSGSNALYAAGDRGVVRFNGLGWASELSLPFRAGALAAADGRLWVVGERTSVLSRPLPR